MIYHILIDPVTPWFVYSGERKKTYKTNSRIIIEKQISISGDKYLLTLILNMRLTWGCLFSCKVQLHSLNTGANRSRQIIMVMSQWTQWRHQPHDCLLNRLFRYRSKKTSKLRVAGLCKGNSPVTNEFPAQRASNADNSSVWWRHHWKTFRLLRKWESKGWGYKRSIGSFVRHTRFWFSKSIA